MPLTDPGLEAIGRTLGKIPSGVFVLTSPLAPGATPPTDPSTPPAHPLTATLVSWVQQAGFEPPTICLAIAKDRPARAGMAVGGAFALAVLGDSDGPLLRRYARGVAPGIDPFDGVAVCQTTAGFPVPAEALAWLDAQVAQVVEVQGDHDLVVARVTAAAVLREGAPFTHIRKNGMRY